MAKPKPRLLSISSIEALKGIIDAIPNPVFVKDEQHRFCILNEAMCDLMGRSYSELIGKTDHDVVPKELADGYIANDSLVLLTGLTHEDEEIFTDFSRSVRTIITRKKRLSLSNGTHLVVGCINDITDFRRAEAQIRHNAEHDHLTGLANLSLFRKELARTIAECPPASRAALLLIDLDGFKGVNDLLGHAAGDNLLVQVSNTLLRLTDKDDVVARLGGDEFAIIKRGPGNASVLAAEVVMQLSKPLNLGGRRTQISASVGISEIADRNSYCENVIRHADLALYRAKRSGRNKWTQFDLDMEASHLASSSLELDLRRAIDRGEFTLVYQPIVGVKNLTVVAYEALLRWTHPTRGPISPGEFIPIAEASGLMAPLGHWVLREACAEAARWKEPYRISINVSPVQFADEDLYATMAAIARETHIDPRRIDLEITETAVIKDLPRARRMFEKLARIGVNVVLDDFGAGYSSLQILKSLPFSRIKIDKSLLLDVGQKPQADAIIRAIVRLTRTLNLNVTVEGVETAEQLAVAMREECDELQGFFLGRPGPAACKYLDSPKDDRLASAAGDHAVAVSLTELAQPSIERPAVCDAS